MQSMMIHNIKTEMAVSNMVQIISPETGINLTGGHLIRAIKGLKMMIMIATNMDINNTMDIDVSHLILLHVSLNNKSSLIST